MNMGLAGWIILGFVVLSFIGTMVISWIIYRTLLIRTDREKWARVMSMPEDEEYVRLYDDAIAWRNRWLGVKKDVEVRSDGLRLCGEYYDFGSDRAVIILSGRMESCLYGCHYAESYRQAGWNVLTIDGRAHGESDGKINSLGYREYRDVIAWAKLLNGQMGVRAVVLHGICIGSSTAVFTAVSPECPACIRGVVLDGIYKRFYDSCRNHMVTDHRPLFPFLWETMLWILLVSRANVMTDGPYRRIRQLKVPALFLHSREDIASDPDKAWAMYEQCPAEKAFVWFDHGGHSRLRITNPEKYDRTIIGYLAEKAF